MTPLLPCMRRGVDPKSASWFHLSDEIKLHVFTYLDRRSLLVAASTCRDWRRVALDDVLWLPLLSEQSQNHVRHVPALAWLSCPKRVRETCTSRLFLMKRVQDALNDRTRITRSVEFAAQPQWQVLGIQAVADVVVTLSTDGHLRSYHVDTLDLVRVSKHAHLHTPTILVREDAAAVNASRVDRLAVSLDPNYAYVWHLPSLRLQCILPHDDAASACVSRDQCFLALWNRQSASLWHILSGSSPSSVALPAPASLPRAEKRRRSRSRSSTNERRRRRSSSSGSQGSRASRRRRHLHNSSRSNQAGLIADAQRMRLLHYRVSFDADEIAARRAAPPSSATWLPEQYQSAVVQLAFLPEQRMVLVAQHRFIVWRVAAPACEQMISVQIGAASTFDVWSVRAHVMKLRCMALGPKVKSRSACEYDLGTGADEYHPHPRPLIFDPAHGWIVFDDSGLWIAGPSAGATHVPNEMSVDQMGHHMFTRSLRDFHEVGSDTRLPPDELRRWQNQRPLLLGPDMVALVTPTRQVVLTSMPTPGVVRPSLALKHYPHAEYPYDLTPQADSFVCATVSLPYVFTAGGPARSIQRWDLMRSEDKRTTSQRIGHHAYALALKFVESTDFEVFWNRFSLTMILVSYILLQMRIDLLIPASTPYWQLMIPVLFTLVMSAITSLVDGSRVFESQYANVERVIGELIAFFCVVAALLLCTLGSALKADGFITWPWQLILAPVYVASTAATIAAVIAAIAQPGDFRWLYLCVAVYLACHTGFIISYLGSVDYPDISLLTGRQAFIFLWCAPAPFLVFVGLPVFIGVSLAVLGALLKLIGRYDLRPAFLDIMYVSGEYPLTPWWRDCDSIVNAVACVVVPAMVLGSQGMLYARTFPPHPAVADTLLYSLILIPVDILLFIAYVYQMVRMRDMLDQYSIS